MKLRWVYGLKLAVGTLLAVGLVRTLLVGSYRIPSSGMENSLYKGEGVLVDKWRYGLRLPLLSWTGYHRLFPREVRKGDVVLFNNPGTSETGVRIENRKVFISRCIGVAGDTLLLNRDWRSVDNSRISPDCKALYAYPSALEEVVTALMEAVGIEGNTLVDYMPDGRYIRRFSHYEFYLLTQKADGRVPFVALDQQSPEVHPIVVPRRGVPVKVYPWNAILLCNTIVHHEHRKAWLQGDTLVVDGRKVSEYRFGKNYYWMASNDPLDLCDSRLFGFVPEDHLIGKAWRLWWTTRPGRWFRRVE